MSFSIFSISFSNAFTASTAKNELVETNLQRLYAAKRLVIKLSSVTVDSLLEEPLEEEVFAPLNQAASAYKTALEDKTKADEAYQKAVSKVADCEKVYEDAKVYTAKTLAE